MSCIFKIKTTNRPRIKGVSSLSEHNIRKNWASAHWSYSTRLLNRTSRSIPRWELHRFKHSLQLKCHGRQEKKCLFLDKI
jgi:hypothetical protein